MKNLPRPSAETVALATGQNGKALRKQIEREADINYRRRTTAKYILHATSADFETYKKISEDWKKFKKTPGLHHISERKPKNSQEKVAATIASARQDIKKALRREYHIEEAVSPEEAAALEPVKIPTLEVVKKIFERLFELPDYREDLNLIRNIAHEEAMIEAMAELIGEAELDLRCESELDDALTSLIAFFYGDKKALLDTFYPGYDNFDPDRPKVDQALVESALTTNPAVQELLATKLLIATRNTRILETLDEKEFEALRKFVLKDNSIQPMRLAIEKDANSLPEFRAKVAVGSIGLLAVVAFISGWNTWCIVIVLAILIFLNFRIRKLPNSIPIQLGGTTLGEYLFCMNEVRKRISEIEDKKSKKDILGAQIAEEEVLLYIGLAKELLGLKPVTQQIVDYTQFLPKATIAPADHEFLAEFFEAEQEAIAASETQPKAAGDKKEP